MPALLEAKGLHAAYGETKVLHGIDFSVEDLSLIHIWFHLHRSVLAIHRVALQKYAADDVVAGVAIGQELVEQIAKFRHFPRLATSAAAAALPEMVMRVDDRQFRFDNWLWRGFGEPCLAQRENASKRGFGLRATHGLSLIHI